MNENMLHVLKNQIRRLEGELSSQNIELHKRMVAAAETEQYVEFLTQQLALVKLQMEQADG
jgi:hypothetical protein